MKRIRKVPELSTIVFVDGIFRDLDSMELARSYNERYLHWDRLQYYDCGKFGREGLWYLMKLIRLNTCKRVTIADLTLSYNLPDRFQRSLHRIDMALSSGIPSISGFDEKRKAMLSVSSMMEESIASSQIEGAVTTTREAKRMLRDGAAPRDRSEQMILNNYKAMGFIRSNLDRELTPDLIRELHGIMTHDTLESLEYEGTFRTDNSIAVRDVLTGEICYEPVSFERIGPLMEGLCAFFNDEEGYIHPIIKAILVHFILAYIHPFMDGNGRVSRSLFYWYAMREGYSLMEYLSISKAIREHKGRYEEAYRLSETDGNDVTYFIDYNLDMIMQSMDVFSEYLREKLEERRSIRDIMDTEDLTRRQTDVLASLMNSDSPLSVYDLSSEMGVSPQTVRNDLNVLIGKGYVRESTKDGHRLRYSYSEKRSKNGSQ